MTEAREFLGYQDSKDPMELQERVIPLIKD
jgi:hypothetical protein